jgi:transposase
MIGLPDGVRVYLAAGRTDLRRGIDGLAAQIQTVLREDPFVLPSLHLPGPIRSRF